MSAMVRILAARCLGCGTQMRSLVPYADCPDELVKEFPVEVSARLLREDLPTGCVLCDGAVQVETEPV